MEKIEYVICNKEHTKFLYVDYSYFRPTYRFMQTTIDIAMTFKSKEEATNTLLEYFENRSSLDENIDDYEILQIKKTLDIIQIHDSYDYTKPIKWHYPLNHSGGKVQKQTIKNHLNKLGLQHDFDWVETRRTTNYAYLTIRFKN